MRYIAAADTDIGIHKSVNQDSVCVKTAETDSASVALIMVCDGMGGLSKGELASAEVVRSFSDWFDNELPYEIDDWNWETAARRTIKRLRILNDKLVRYGAENNIRAGTTATGIIAVNSGYMTFHAGDTRIYKIASDLRQLTDDHTFINREIKRGNMTPQQAMTDPRRNALIQCVGASGDVEPEVKFGNLESGANYMICSDGFRHVLEPKEIFDELSPKNVVTKKAMEKSLRRLIDTVKERSERDNITAAMFRAEF